MSDSPARDDLGPTIESLRDGTISPEKHAQLQETLRDDVEARAYYIEYQLMCAGLEGCLGEGGPPVSDADRAEAEAYVVPLAGKEEKAAGRHWWPLGLATAAAVALLVLGGQYWMSRLRREPTANLATLVASIDAHWGGGISPHVGTTLTPRSLELKQGLAELRFASGATVILQGPVECLVESPSHLTLQRGRVTAQVPVQAIGFTVRTAQATVVDLGTEFGVNSEEGRATDVHVFRGQIALGAALGREAGRQLVSEGIAKRIAEAGARIEDIPSDELAFVGRREFEARIKARHNSPYHRWLAASYQFRRQPALVLYYTFDSAGDERERVLNRAGATAGRLDARLGNGVEAESQPQWVPSGRWPEQRALRFDASRHQQLCVRHSNELNMTQAVTVATWIRPNTALLEPKAVIATKRVATPGGAQANYELGLLSSGPAQGQGLCSLYFQAGDGKLVSPGISVVPGQWLQVAAVTDRERTALFVNGQRIALGPGVELTPNDADLCIGSPVDGRHEAFEGMLSEFVLMRRAMSDDEIRDIYTAGVPQP